MKLVHLIVEDLEKKRQTRKLKDSFSLI